MSVSWRSDAFRPAANEIESGYFALGDDAALAAVHEFDWLLDRHHVLGKVFINEVDQRGLRGSFARTGRTSHEHETATQVSEVLDDSGNAQIFERRNCRRNQSKCRGVTFDCLK